MFQIHANRKFLMDGQTLTFRRYVRGKEQPYVFEDEDRFPLTFSHEELAEARDMNRLRDWTAPSPAIVRADSIIQRAPITFSSATEMERLTAERNQDYVNAWLAKPGTPKSVRGLAPIIEAVHARRAVMAEQQRCFEPPPLSVSRLQQLIRRYQMAGEVADALVPQVRLRGNHRQRLSQTVMDIIQDKIDDVYLVRNGQNVAGLHRIVVDEIERGNLRNRSGSPLMKPSYQAVRRVVGGLCPYTITFCREGEQAANARFRQVGSGIVTERANEVWEIDDTRVDLICLHEDGKTVIGRPWMTVVIDRHTRMIMSFVLTFSPPDTESALEAMRLAIHRKERLALGGPDLRSDWPAEGRPDAVHVDNGKQYNSAAFKRGVTRLGIQHNTLPVLKAWYKGTVERLIGTVMRQVFHLVPGTTHSNIFDRDREAPPEQVAVATLADAKAKLLAWVVNEYQHRPHRGIGSTPYKMWKESLQKHPLRMPHAREQIDVALSVTAARTIRNGGIEVDGLRYLTAHGLRLEMAPGRGGEREVVVRRNPGDLTVIQFLDAGVGDPTREVWHDAHICAAHKPRVVGRTLDEYRLAKQLRANSPDLSNDDLDWNRTYEMVGADLQDEASSHRLGDRVRAEGKRERIIQQAERRTTTERNAGTIEEGDDLQARLDATEQFLPADDRGAVPLVASEGLSPDHFRRGRAPRSRRRDAEEV